MMQDQSASEPWWRRRQFYRMALAWGVIGIILWLYTVQIARIGLNLRDFTWEFTRPSWYSGDITTGMQAGAQVLQHAEDLQLPGGTQTTVWDRGDPGLLDPPVNLHNLSARWRILQPVYARIVAGWVDYYDQMYNRMQDDKANGQFTDTLGANPNTDMDYPPMRLMMMTLWMWNVQNHYPGLDHFPNVPPPNRHYASDAVGYPIMAFNTLCTGVASVAAGFLVWVWVYRGGTPVRQSPVWKWVRRRLGWKQPVASIEPDDWRQRWGDPVLVLPVLAFWACWLLRSQFTWTWDVSGLSDGGLGIMDERATDLAWWIFLVLRFSAAVSLARLLPHPFRGAACGLIAGTLLWLCPIVIYNSHGWPQWDTWQFPFYIGGALLLSLNFWTAAGIWLGIGTMFKGQIAFAIPVLVLCPLLAGYWLRFLKIVAGVVAGGGIVVLPWLVTNAAAEKYIWHVVIAVVLVSAATLLRRPLVGVVRRLWQWMMGRLTGPLLPVTFRQSLPWIATVTVWVLMLIAAVLVLKTEVTDRTTRAGILCLCAVLLVVPWISWKHIPACLVIGFAGALVVAGYAMGGRDSWWQVGFLYGTQRHPEMQLGNPALASFGAILNERYGWGTHDAVGTLTVPFLGDIPMDLQSAMVTVYGIALLLCTIGAAIQLRRNDPRFLAAVAAPYILFPTLLTQMSARYFCLPAALSVLMVGVSVPMSLTYLLLTFIGLGVAINRRVGLDQLAPRAAQIVRPMHPDAGWLMLLMGIVYVAVALTPRRSNRTRTLRAR